MKTVIATWDEVLRICKSDTYLYYKAPMDHYPSPVVCVRVFKNGKVRIHAGGGSKFTADSGHLGRFMKLGGES